MTQSAALTVVVDTSFSGVGLQWPLAEPAEALTYYLDAAQVLSGEGVISVAVSAKPSGTGELMVISVAEAAGIITVGLAGGVYGRVYTVRVELLTVYGRTFSWLVTLPLDPTYATYPIPLPPVPGFGAPVVWTSGLSPQTLVVSSAPGVPTALDTAASRTLVVDDNNYNTLQWPIAEPADSLDYYLELGQTLAAAGDSIFSVTACIKPSGAGELQGLSIGATATEISVELAGGVPGRTYLVRFDVATYANRTFSWLVTLPIDIDYAVPPIPLPPDPGFGPPIIFSNKYGMLLENGVSFWELENGLGIWLWG